MAVQVSHAVSGDVLPPPGYAKFVVERLKGAGIPIVAYDPTRADQARLLILLSDREDWVDMELRQLVALERDPNIKMEAATWWITGRSLPAEDRKKEQIPVEMLDDFIHDYLLANPPKQHQH